MASGSGSIIPFYTKPDLGREFYTSSILAAISQRDWIYDPHDAAIDEGLIFEKLRRDVQCAASIENSLKAIAGLDWHYSSGSSDPGDKLAASFQTDLARQTKDFWLSRYNLAKARFLGETWAVITGTWKMLRLRSDTTERLWWVPTGLVDVDKRRFRRVPVEGPQGTPIKFALEMSTLSGWGDQPAGSWIRVNHPKIFVRHVHETYEGALGYSRGLVHTLYYWLRAKTLLMEGSLEFCERWAQGVLTAKIDSLRMGTPGTDNDTHRQSWIDELEKLRARNVLVYGKEDQMLPVWPSGTGYEAQMGLLRYIDQGMQRLIEASDQPTGGGTPGSGTYAGARVQAREKDDYFASDIVRLGSTLDEQWSSLIWRMNERTLKLALAEQGFELNQPSQFLIGQEERFDTQQVMSILQVAKTAGLPLKRSWVYRTLGIPEPGPKDDIIGGEVGAAAGVPGGAPGAPPAGTMGAPPTQPPPPQGGAGGPAPDGGVQMLDVEGLTPGLGSSGLYDVRLQAFRARVAKARWARRRRG